jgi:hypothetical protein
VFAQIRLGGFVEYDNITYFRKTGGGRINGRNQAILQLELRVQINEMANIFNAVEMRYDQANASRGRIYLDEVYADLYFGDFDIRLGKQIYAWGRADGFNPTDNLTSWDYTDVLDTDAERIGLISARVTYYFGDWSLEGVLAPLFTPSQLPDVTSRWWPDMPPVAPNPASHLVGDPTLSARYIFARPVFPEDGMKSTQYALRLSGTSGGWDYSFSWFDGFDNLPAVHTRSVVNSTFTNAIITQQYQYHRRRAIGADFATTFGPLGLRGEGAYYITQDWSGSDPAIDDPYLLYVLGLNYTFRNVFSDKDLFVLVQWIQEVQVPDRHSAYGLYDFNHIYRKTIMGKTELRLGTYTTIACLGVYNIWMKDWWVRPTIEWSVTDGVVLRASVDLLGGPDESFFGSFQDNTRMQFQVKYSF